MDNPFKALEKPQKEISLASGTHTQWVEEYFSYTEDQKGGQFLSPFSKQKHLILLFSVILLIFVGLFGRLAYLQLMQGDVYAAMAEGNRTKKVYLVPHRGVIHDRNGKPLVRNLPDYYLQVTPAFLPKDENELDSFLIKLSEIVQKDPNFLKEELQLDDFRTLFSYQPIVLQESLDYKAALRLKIVSSQFPGVDVQVGTKRQYLLGEKRMTMSLSHLLGYVGKMNEDEYAQLKKEGYFITDVIGKTGLEEYYESILKGQNGYQLLEVDAFGREISVIDVKESQPGSNMFLTIDADLQADVEKLLQDYLVEHEFEKGVAIVMNPHDFSILAMVSLPGFDNNEFAQGIGYDRFQELITDESKPLFHRAIHGAYPPGSTFKLVMGAAGLQEGVIDALTSVSSVGGIQVGSWFFPDWKAGGHGLVNMYKALAESVNTYFYMIGGGYQQFSGLGIDKINAYASLFGLGNRLGIDLNAETTGLLPTPEWKQKTIGEKWYIGDTYHVSIGQGFLTVTPLQVAAFTSVFANGGSLYTPHLLKSYIQDGEEVQNEEQLVNAQFIESEYLKVVRDGMARAVLSGSAQKLNGLPVSVAAKTGTAQFSSVKKEHSWLTSFAPYEDPEIVVTVLIEEGGEGSESAIVVARDILNTYFQKYADRE